MYPVYCFWVGEYVVQVPTGGDLKWIRMSRSTGDRIVLTSAAKKFRGGDCPRTTVQENSKLRIRM